MEEVCPDALLKLQDDARLIWSLVVVVESESDGGKYVQKYHKQLHPVCSVMHVRH